MLAPTNAPRNLISHAVTHATNVIIFCQNGVMPFDPDKFHRASIRLRGYDYRGIGVYFVTICAHQKRCIFGRVQNDVMRLNRYGIIADNSWRQTAEMRARVELDEYVMMPQPFSWFAMVYCAAPRRSTTKMRPEVCGARPILWVRSSAVGRAT